MHALQGNLGASPGLCWPALSAWHGMRKPACAKMCFDLLWQYHSSIPTHLHKHNISGLLPCRIQVDDVLMLQSDVQADLWHKTQQACVDM
jgi:hypothetical protein